MKLIGEMMNHLNTIFYFFFMLENRGRGAGWFGGVCGRPEGRGNVDMEFAPAYRCSTWSQNKALVKPED